MLCIVSVVMLNTALLGWVPQELCVLAHKKINSAFRFFHDMQHEAGTARTGIIRQGSRHCSWTKLKDQVTHMWIFIHSNISADSQLSPKQKPIGR